MASKGLTLTSSRLVTLKSLDENAATHTAAHYNTLQQHTATTHCNTLK